MPNLQRANERFNNTVTKSVASSTRTAYCYITISDGSEYCYYYPSTGYECETGPDQDVQKRNMSACNYMGMLPCGAVGRTKWHTFHSPFTEVPISMGDRKKALAGQVVAKDDCCSYVRTCFAPQSLVGHQPEHPILSQV